MRTNHIFKAALAGAVALLAACTDSTGSSSAGTGSLSFGYSGARAGSYGTSGKFRLTSESTFAKQPFAVALRATEGGQAYIGLMAYQPVTAARGNQVLMAFPDVTGTGTFTLDDSCTGTDDLCTLGLVAFDTNPDLSEEEANVFMFSSGTLNVTADPDGRLHGTFSGTAEMAFADSSITITNGSFDVPVVDHGSLVLDRAAAAARLQGRSPKP